MRCLDAFRAEGAQLTCMISRSNGDNLTSDANPLRLLRMVTEVAVLRTRAIDSPKTDRFRSILPPRKAPFHDTMNVALPHELG